VRERERERERERLGFEDPVLIFYGSHDKFKETPVKMATIIFLEITNACRAHLEM
jgi:hypothetical protein